MNPNTFMLIVRPDHKLAYTSPQGEEIIILDELQEKWAFVEMVKAGYPEIMPEDILPGFGAKGRISKTGWDKLVVLSRKIGAEIQIPEYGIAQGNNTLSHDLRMLK